MPAVRIILPKHFERECKRTGLDDEAFRTAAREIDEGKVEARLGGYLVKKRVARPGGGKSGGFRTIVAHRQGNRLVFMHLFAKSEKENIDAGEKEALHDLSDQYMALTDAKMDELIEKHVLREIEND